MSRGFAFAGRALFKSKARACAAVLIAPVLAGIGMAIGGLVLEVMTGRLRSEPASEFLAHQMTMAYVYTLVYGPLCCFTTVAVGIPVLGWLSRRGGLKLWSALAAGAALAILVAPTLMHVLLSAWMLLGAGEVVLPKLAGFAPEDIVAYGPAGMLVSLGLWIIGGVEGGPSSATPAGRGEPSTHPRR